MIPREEIADYSCLVTCSQREDCVLAQRLSPGLLAGLLSRLYVRVSISLLGDTHICWAFPLKAAPLKLCHIVKWEQRKWLSCGSTQAWLALLCVILKGHGRVVLFPDTTKGHGDLAGQQSLGSTFYLAGTVGMHHHSPLFFFFKTGFLWNPNEHRFWWCLHGKYFPSRAISAALLFFWWYWLSGLSADAQLSDLVVRKSEF